MLGAHDFPSPTRPLSAACAAIARVDAKICGEAILRVLDADVLAPGVMADLRDFRPIPQGRPT